MKKISLSVYLLFSFIYWNQGIWALKAAPLYYLQREVWGLSVSMMALIGVITTIPWTIKPILSILVEYILIIPTIKIKIVKNNVK